MGQMFDKTHHQMDNWRWDDLHAFGDQVDLSNQSTTSLGMFKRTGERYSWYGSDDLRAMIEPPGCWQYMPSNFLAIGLLNSHEIINKDEDDQNWAHLTAPSGGRTHSSNGNDNDDGKGEKDMQGSEKGTRKEKGPKDGKGKGKGKAMEGGKGKGNGKGKGIVKQTPGGDDISCAVPLQLQKDMYVADSDTEG